MQRCECGERVIREGLNPGEDYVIFGKRILIKSGVMYSVCKKCKKENVVKPTLVRLKKSQVK